MDGNVCQLVCLAVHHLSTDINWYQKMNPSHFGPDQTLYNIIYRDKTWAGTCWQWQGRTFIGRNLEQNPASADFGEHLSEMCLPHLKSFLLHNLSCSTTTRWWMHCGQATVSQQDLSSPRQRTKIHLGLTARSFWSKFLLVTWLTTWMFRGSFSELSWTLPQHVAMLPCCYWWIYPPPMELSLAAYLALSPNMM